MTLRNAVSTFFALIVANICLMQTWRDAAVALATWVLVFMLAKAVRQ